MRLSREHPVQIADLTHGARRVRSRNKVWRINIVTNIFDAMFNFSIITPIIILCHDGCWRLLSEINVVSYFRMWIAMYHFADGNGPPFRGSAIPIPNPTRSSAIAEGTRDAPCQLNRAKCRTNVRRIAFDKSCNRPITFKISRGHWRWHKSIGHMILPVTGV